MPRFRCVFAIFSTSKISEICCFLKSIGFAKSWSRENWASADAYSISTTSLMRAVEARSQSIPL